MGRLFDAVSTIDQVIASRGLDPMKTKGEIGLKSGFFLALVFPDTPDDAERITKLRAATMDVLGIDVHA